MDLSVVGARDYIETRQYKKLWCTTGFELVEIEEEATVADLQSRKIFVVYVRGQSRTLFHEDFIFPFNMEEVNMLFKTFIEAFTKEAKDKARAERLSKVINKPSLERQTSASKRINGLKERLKETARQKMELFADLYPSLKPLYHEVVNGS